MKLKLGLNARVCVRNKYDSLVLFINSGGFRNVDEIGRSPTVDRLPSLFAIVK